MKQIKILNPLYRDKEYLVTPSLLYKAELITQMAELYADLNMIHPFREGNGRTQRILELYPRILFEYNSYSGL